MKNFISRGLMLVIMIMIGLISLNKIHGQTTVEIPEITITGNQNEALKYTSVVTVSFVVPDGRVVYYRHDLNGNTIHSYVQFSVSIKLNTNGRHVIEYYAVDSENNESPRTEVTIDIVLDVIEDNEFVERGGKNITYYKTTEEVRLPAEYQEKEHELRAVWVSTVTNIDIGRHTSEQQYKTALTTILDNVRSNNMNAVFFQVRPMNDAFYQSDYAPWSRFLTGTEGKSPGWDVLEYAISEAHKRGIEFHAWLNPYRVSSSGDLPKSAQLATLSDNNFAKMYPQLVMADNDGKLILNPGEPQVVTYITNVINELITKYDIDGIHFDDYFYSYGGTPEVEDASAYQNNNDDNLSLADWRRQNINNLVADLSVVIKTHNNVNDKHVKFGISPFGVWRSKSAGAVDGANVGNTSQSYSAQYADSKKWVEMGWLDYICPQLYWGFSHSSAPYADLVDWWADLCASSGVDLIIGQGLYRVLEGGSDWQNINELLEQIRYASKHPAVKGFSIFSYKTMQSQDLNILQALKRLNNYYWQARADFPWESTVVLVDYQVSLQVNSNHGTVTGLDSNTYHYGTTIKLIATPLDGYAFKEWNINGNILGRNNAVIEVLVDDNMDIEAIFEPLTDLDDDKDKDIWMIITIAGSILGGALLAFGFVAIVKKRKKSEKTN